MRNRLKDISHLSWLMWQVRDADAPKPHALTARRWTRYSYNLLLLWLPRPPPAEFKTFTSARLIWKIFTIADTRALGPSADGKASRSQPTLQGDLGEGSEKGRVEQKFSGSRRSAQVGGKKAMEKVAWEAQGREEAGVEQPLKGW